MGLSVPDKKMAQTVQAPDAANAGMEWQLLYDGAGYFKIKNRLTGKLLSSSGTSPGNSPVTQANNTNSDNLKWRMEWDGTGYCRLISKIGGRAISNGRSAAANSPLVQAPDSASDNLRWKIVPQ